MAKLFSEVLKSLREARQLSVSDFGERVKMPTGTLYAYESRRRGVPPERASLLREKVCVTDAERAEFDEAYAANGQLRGQSALQEKFGAETAVLYIGDLIYPPFSGSSHAFCNRFLAGILNPAVLKMEDAAASRFPQEASEAAFAMDERMRWIEDGDADVIINLQNPMRMRKLKFLPTPIRVTLNGVILTKGDEDIRNARKQLVGVEDASESAASMGTSMPFKLMAIKHEVGHVFLKEIRKVEEEIELADTLDAQLLADRLQHGSRTMLVCDELTALAVVAKKDGAATLVLPPSTDQSDLHFEARRKLPAHYLGFGIARSNEEVIDFLTEAIQNFISTEVETVAELLATLYEDLVETVKASYSKNDFVYSGGVRRVSKFMRNKEAEEQKRLDSKDVDSVPENQQPGLNDPRKLNLQLERRELEKQFESQVFATLIEQNSRAFARRCLNISKRSVADSPDELWKWRHVLKRARQRILISDARNRASVREIIVFAMKSCLGLDPIGNWSESYCDYFEEAINSEHWTDFREMIERDLDMTLPSTLDPMRSDRGGGFWTPCGKHDASPFSTFEWFVSAVQRSMEATTESARLVSVKHLHLPQGLGDGASDRTATQDNRKQIFDRLWEQYCIEVGRTGRSSEQDAKAICLIAFSLGQAVGFITATLKDFRDLPSLQVEDMYVIPMMRRSGISRRLIRALIEAAHILQPEQPSRKPDEKWECVYVWIATGFRPHVSLAFERSGFTKSARDSAYFYRLYGLEGTAHNTLLLN